MFRAITFDFWNTLYPAIGQVSGPDIYELRARELRGFLVELGHDFPLDHCDAAHRHAEERLLKHWRTDLRYSGADRAVVDISEFLGIGLSEAEGRELVHRLQLTGRVVDVKPFAGVPSMLRGLASDYRLGIVSDTWLTSGVRLRPLLDAHGLLDCFRAFVFSDETGFLKPHENQFRVALGALGTRPEDTVHVGDSERRDVLGAQALGMKTVWFDVNRTGAASAADVVIRDIAALGPAIAGL